MSELLDIDALREENTRLREKMNNFDEGVRLKAENEALLTALDKLERESRPSDKNFSTSMTIGNLPTICPAGFNVSIKNTAMNAFGDLKSACSAPSEANLIVSAAFNLKNGATEEDVVVLRDLLNARVPSDYLDQLEIPEFLSWNTSKTEDMLFLNAFIGKDPFDKLNADPSLISHHHMSLELSKTPDGFLTGTETLFEGFGARLKVNMGVKDDIKGFIQNLVKDAKLQALLLSITEFCSIVDMNLGIGSIAGIPKLIKSMIEFDDGDNVDENYPQELERSGEHHGRELRTLIIQALKSQKDKNLYLAMFKCIAGLDSLNVTSNVATVLCDFDGFKLPSCFPSDNDLSTTLDDDDDDDEDLWD